MDVVVYTGFGFPGRDLLLTRSSDAVILGCGRIGTIHEFTIAYEDQKPIGILEGPWKTDEIIKNIINASNRPAQKVIFDSDPRALIERLAEMVRKDKQELMLLHRNYDGVTGVKTEGDLIL
jgi:predicted Rossmann-fold nucleotide-binding protein